MYCPLLRFCFFMPINTHKQTQGSNQESMQCGNSSDQTWKCWARGSTAEISGLQGPPLWDPGLWKWDYDKTTKVRSYSKGPCNLCQKLSTHGSAVYKGRTERWWNEYWEIVDFFYRVESQQECLCLLKEFNYLQNPLKRNVSTNYSQFPLIKSYFSSVGEAQ